MLKASFTVEAAIIIPFILFAVTGGINIGYEMFREAKLNAEIQEELIKLDPVEIVRKQTFVQQLETKQ